MTIETELRVCEFPGCGRKYDARGYCSSHYLQLRQGKRVSKLIADMTLEERFLKGFEKGGPEECWEWGMAPGPFGYGQMTAPGGKLMRAHRVAFFLRHGYYPDFVDHICRNRKCVNPDHLQETDKQRNAENTGMRIDNTSGYKGVSRHTGGRWQANASYRGKQYYLGLFDTPEEAGKAAKDFRLKHHTNNLEDRA